jgi:hypothetical protein
MPRLMKHGILLLRLRHAGWSQHSNQSSTRLSMPWVQHTNIHLGITLSLALLLDWLHVFLKHFTASVRHVFYFQAPSYERPIPSTYSSALYNARATSPLRPNVSE